MAEVPAESPVLLSLTIRDRGEGHEDDGGRYAAGLVISNDLPPILMVDMTMLAVQVLGDAVPPLRALMADQLRKARDERS